MRYDSIAPLMDPVYPLEVTDTRQKHTVFHDDPYSKDFRYRPHGKQPAPYKKNRYQRKADYSWPIDPDDLSRRLLVVIAERESKARQEARRRGSVGADQALRLARENRAREARDRQQDTLVTRARKVLSLHAPQTVEPPRHERLDPSFFRPRSAAISAAQPHAPVFGPNKVLSAAEDEQEAAATSGPATRDGHAHAPYTNPSSRNVQVAPNADAVAGAADGHYVPRVAATQFTKTATADCMLEEPSIRQNARRVSTHPGHETNPHQRAPRAHNDVDARLGKRRSMVEPMRGAPSLEGRSFARRMSTGDLLNIPERPATEQRGYFETVNDHRVDWTQTDEEGKKSRPWKILRKVDSLFHLSSKLGSSGSKPGSKPGSRGSKEAGDAGSLGSTGFDDKVRIALVDEKAESPKSQASKSLKSPRLVKARSFWPFRN